MKTITFRRWLTVTFINLLFFTQMVEAATVTLATSPLANVTTSVVRPNVMYILDNSGSTAWDYLPDYVSAGSAGTGSQICWSGTSDSNSRATCSTTQSVSPLSTSNMIGSSVQVPFTTSDINYIYYNPNIYYQLPIKADKSSYPASDPTAAKSNILSGTSVTTNLVNGTTIATLTGTITNTSTTVSGLSSSVGLLGSYVTGTGIPSNTYVTALPTASTITLSTAATATGSSSLTFKTGGYPHQVYCNTSSPTAQALRGGQSGDICRENTDTTGNVLWPFGSYTNVNSYSGAPYYYTMGTMEYCTDSTYANCTASADTTHTVEAKYRWCNSYSTSTQLYSNCQDLRDATHTIPDYLGGVQPAVGSNTQASAILTITSYVPGLSITTLTINGVNVIGSSASTINAANTVTGIAQAICTAIHNNMTTSGYDCPTTPSTGSLTIKANIPPAFATYAATNGFAIVLNSAAAPTSGTGASGTLTINSTTGATKVDDITVGGISIIAAAAKPQLFADGTATTAIASTMSGLINANSGVSGYTATSSNNIITITRTAVGPTTSAIALVSTGTKPTATITVGTTGQTAGLPADLGGISVGATSIVGHLSPSVLTNGTATSTNAAAIASNIIGATGYSASASGSVVTVTGPTASNALNGTALAFSAGTAVAPVTAVPAVQPTGLITFGGGSTSNGNPSSTISNNLTGSGSVRVGSTNASTSSISIGKNKSPSSVASSVVSKIGTSGTIHAFVGGNSVTPTCASQSSNVVCLVDTSTVTNGSAVSIGTFNNQGTITVSTTATAGGSAGTPGVTGNSNFAPALSGTTFSGGRTAQSATGSNLGSAIAGANAAGPINSNATSPNTLTMSGGVDASSLQRVRLGKFTQVNIVPSVNSYPASGNKAVGRTDCAGSTCTYAEELQNFANWYGYYRHRQNLMKSSSTLAFDKLDAKYRVGFDLLSHYSTGKVDLQVAQFVDSGGETASQRTNWWNNLINSTTSGSTPLRSEVLKIGKYYAGKLSTTTTTPATAEVLAKAIFTIGSPTSNGATISALSLENVPLLGSTFTVSGCGGSNGACSTSTNLNSVASALVSAMTSYIASSAYTSVVPAQPNYTISRSNNTITITAPAGSGSSLNGNALGFTTAGTISISNTQDMAGGVDAVPAVTASAYEPMQYSCQQNFAILVTDGYWNSDYDSQLKQLDGSTLIGDQDNVNSGYTTRPRFDGAVAATSTCSDSNFSSCSTLADITAYFYKTDLRDASLGNKFSGTTSQDVSVNNVFTSSTDSNTKQHMVFFGMGLGAPGTLRYSTSYLTDTGGDYNNILNGTLNWPAPKQNDPTTIDDLWHAAVNGYGKYFSARDPVTVSNGLNESLTSIQARVGAAAAAATSNLEPVAGDNFAYLGSYETVSWVGEIQAHTINVNTGAISTDTNCGAANSGCVWSAQSLLDSATWSTRNIYMAPTSGTSGSAPRAFTYANLNGTEQAYFDPSSLSQYGTIFAAYPTEATASNLVNFLRGDRSLEATGASGHHDIWRLRTHVLGDIVNNQPVYVKVPGLNYIDAGFSSYVSSLQSRSSVVYVGANDGMLHALDATTGNEIWAYVPQAALPAMKLLADSDYADLHQYFVDGQITVGDVNFGGGSSDWHTVLVAGLGRGGREYFALDITDPQNPKYLWEFTDTNLGYTYSNPSINKLPNGQWAVFFTSGYNNTSSGDGKGYLYAVNPQTGSLLSGFPLTTGSGTSTSPSNLGKISAYITDINTDNTADYIYAGDLNGDLWRFDLSPSTTGHSGVSVFKLAHLADASGNAQPISTRPELTTVDNNRVVYVGTGQYLGTPDLSDTNVQSFYAIKDTLGADNFTVGGNNPQVTWNPRSDLGTVSGSTVNLFQAHKLISKKDDGSQITTSSGGNGRQICIGASSQVSAATGLCTNESGTAATFTNYGGWYIDLPDSGERINVDINLTLGTLTFASNVPASSACAVGGYSYGNSIDFKTGLAIQGTSLVISQYLSNALVVGINVLKTVSGGIVANYRLSGGDPLTQQVPSTPGAFSGKRSLWRELDQY